MRWKDHPRKPRRYQTVKPVQKQVSVGGHVVQKHVSVSGRVVQKYVSVRGRVLVGIL